MHKNQQKNNKLIVLNESSSINDHKKIQEYCSPDFCLSCTYFQQIKGNFGRCGVLQKDRKFDGSRKKSGCRLWRINPEIKLEPVLQQRPDRAGGYSSPAPVGKRVHHPVAYEFHELLQPVLKEKRLQELEEMKPETLKKLENLNYNSTSEKTGSFHYYYRSKTPAYVIDYIMSMIEKSMDYDEIMSKVWLTYNYKISRGLIYLIKLKFHKGEFRQIPDLMRKTINTKCPKCECNSVVKNGFGYTGHGICLQMLRCKNCNYKFREKNESHISKHRFGADVVKTALELLDGTLSYRQISKALLEFYNIKISPENLLKWKQKFKPEVIMSKQRPVNEETKRKISVSAELDSYKRRKNKELVAIIQCKI